MILVLVVLILMYCALQYAATAMKHGVGELPNMTFRACIEHE